MSTVVLVVAIAMLTLVLNNWRVELNDWRLERRNARRAHG
jgi:hypothetical protein